MTPNNVTAQRVVGALILALVGIALLVTVIIVQSVKYNDLRSEVNVACAGVVAELDLTDWIVLCR